MVGIVSIFQSKKMGVVEFLSFMQYIQSEIGIGKLARSQFPQQYYSAYIWTLVDQVCFLIMSPLDRADGHDSCEIVS